MKILGDNEVTGGKWNNDVGVAAEQFTWARYLAIGVIINGSCISYEQILDRGGPFSGGDIGILTVSLMIQVGEGTSLSTKRKLRNTGNVCCS